MRPQGESGFAWGFIATNGLRTHGIFGPGLKIRAGAAPRTPSRVKSPAYGRLELYALPQSRDYFPDRSGFGFFLDSHLHRYNCAWS